VTYCLGIMTRQGLVLASDSRPTPATTTWISAARCTSSLCPGNGSSFSCAAAAFHSPVGAHSPAPRLRPGHGPGGGADDVRRRARDRRTDPTCRGHRPLSPGARRLSLQRPRDSGGQIRGEPHGLYLIYPQGNPLRPPRIRLMCRSASASTVGLSSIAAFATAKRRLRRQPSTP